MIVVCIYDDEEYGFFYVAKEVKGDECNMGSTYAERECMIRCFINDRAFHRWYPNAPDIPNKGCEYCWHS